MGVDHTNKYASTSSGRPSVRLTSKNSYSAGTAIILDVAHMPGGICGTWPAFWTVGANWPNNGEIDIIEGVNNQTSNSMTLHTSSGCSIDSTGFSGSLVTPNCDVNAAGQSNNAGCSISDTTALSYGVPFNNNKGGVFATVFGTSAIDIYFFPRGSIPADIASGNPTGTGWGTPHAHFAGGCDIPNKIKQQSIVFDTTFCGDWAGADFTTGSCKSFGSCTDYVGNNPSAFTNAYWQINSLKVYSTSGSSSNVALSSAGAVSSAAASSVAAKSSSAASSPIAAVSSVAKSSSTPSPIQASQFAPKSSSAAQTTFAVSTKAASSSQVRTPSIPISTAINATIPSFPAGNATAIRPTGSGFYPAGNATRTAFASGTGVVANITNVTSTLDTGETVYITKTEYVTLGSPKSTQTSLTSASVQAAAVSSTVTAVAAALAESSVASSSAAASPTSSAAPQAWQYDWFGADSKGRPAAPPKRAAEHFHAHKHRRRHIGAHH